MFDTTRRKALCTVACSLAGVAGAALSHLRPWFATTVAAPGPVAAGPRAPPDIAGAASGRLSQWTHLVLKLIPKYQQNPLRAARCLSYGQVAMHDAWVHAAGAWPQASHLAERAAHRAASRVLEHLYPHETPTRFEAGFAALCDFLPMDALSANAADALGLQVASTLIARSLRDGAGRTWSPRQRPADFPGAWQPAFPLYAATPAEGMAPEWKPWLAPSPLRADPPAPPRPGSEAYRRETLEVLQVHRRLDAEQARLAKEWNLDAGSVTPGGIWMQITLREMAARPTVSQGTGGPPPVMAAATAVAVALHDAFIACWRVKLREWTERPVTAVRRELDPAFSPLLVTPGFPSYVSGHACVSAAAATVLSQWVPARASALEALASEAAQSRLWGGIHFRSDNEQGTALGRAVGREVVAWLDA